MQEIYESDNQQHAGIIVPNFDACVPIVSHYTISVPLEYRRSSHASVLFNESEYGRIILFGGEDAKFCQKDQLLEYQYVPNRSFSFRSRYGTMSKSGIHRKCKHNSICNCSMTCESNHLDFNPTNHIHMQANHSDANHMSSTSPLLLPSFSHSEATVGGNGMPSSYLELFTNLFPPYSTSSLFNHEGTFCYDDVEKQSSSLGLASYINLPDIKYSMTLTNASHTLGSQYRRKASFSRSEDEMAHFENKAAHLSRSDIPQNNVNNTQQPMENIQNLRRQLCQVLQQTKYNWSPTHKFQCPIGATMQNIINRSLHTPETAMGRDSHQLHNSTHISSHKLGEQGNFKQNHSKRLKNEKPSRMDFNCAEWKEIKSKKVKQATPTDNLYYIREQFQNETAENFPHSRKFHQIAHESESNRIWIFAGESKFADERTSTKYKYVSLSDLWSFDTKNQTWRKHTSILHNTRSIMSDSIPFKPIYGHTLVKIKRKLYCFGGCSNGGVMSHNEMTNRLCELDLDTGFEYDDFRGIWIANWKLIHPFACRKSLPNFNLHHTTMSGRKCSPGIWDRSSPNCSGSSGEGTSNQLYTNHPHTYPIDESHFASSTQQDTMEDIVEDINSQCTSHDENCNDPSCSCNLPTSIRLVQYILKAPSLDEITKEFMRTEPQREATIHEKPSGRYGHSAMNWKDRFMIIFGGNARNDVWIYDTETSVWFEVKSLNMHKLSWQTSKNINSSTDEEFHVLDIPLGRKFHASCLLGDCIYVYGGDCKTHILDQLSTLYCFSLRTCEWTRLKLGRCWNVCPPRPRVYHSLHPVFDRQRQTQCLLLIGGYEGLSSDVSETISVFELNAERQCLISNLWHDNRDEFCDCIILTSS